MLTNILLYTLLSILGIAVSIHLFLYLYPYSYLVRQNCKEKAKQQKNNRQATDENKATDDDNIQLVLPPVSVIICAKNEEENLRNFLPLVLEQNYPEYEVIIVNDGSVDDTIDLLIAYQRDYPQLTFTSIPEETRIISHKKLAITIGVKAAKYEHLLFTDADCRPLTADWITDMMSQFEPQTEFVLGYGGYYRTKKFISTIISYDTLLIAMRYMGFASIGKPYMGVGRNMAYLKSTFMKNKGFAGMLHLVSGDDDLLINRFGNKRNVALAPSAESQTLSLPKDSFKEWYIQKKRHLSTSGIYSKSSKTLLGLEPMSTALFYLSTIALISLFYNNIVAITSIIGALLLKFIPQYAIINRTARIYREKPFALSLILCDVLLPLTSLWIMASAKIFRRKNKIIWK